MSQPIPIDYISVVAVERMAMALNDNPPSENNGFHHNERLAKICYAALKGKFHLVIKDSKK